MLCGRSSRILGSFRGLASVFFRCGVIALLVDRYHALGLLQKLQCPMESVRRMALGSGPTCDSHSVTSFVESRGCLLELRLSKYRLAVPVERLAVVAMTLAPWHFAAANLSR
jgi:hypothetical protein